MKKMVVLNHKLYMNYDDVKEYIREVKDHIRMDIDVVMCPSSIFIPYFKGRYNFYLGTQNLSGTVATGEVSGLQLKSLDVRYALVGHSERKINLKETNKMINTNIKEALKYNIIPIVCLGETKEEHERKKTAEVIIKQLKDYFFDVEVLADVVLAYEPIWAIGSNMVPKNKEIEEIVQLIKDVMFKKFNVNIRVLYGGSVNLKTIDKLNEIVNIDGYLLGRVSTDTKALLMIMDKM